MLYHHILLIDDDEDDHEIFLSALAMASASVKCTAINNANTGLKKLTEGQIHPDMIFLDLNMPTMNGQQFLQCIKKHERLKHIPIIIFSTSSRLETIKETKALGAYDFITKPDKFNELVNILRSILN